MKERLLKVIVFEVGRLAVALIVGENYFWLIFVSTGQSLKMMVDYIKSQIRFNLFNTVLIGISIILNLKEQWVYLAKRYFQISLKLSLSIELEISTPGIRLVIIYPIENIENAERQAKTEGQENVDEATEDFVMLFG